MKEGVCNFHPAATQHPTGNNAASHQGAGVISIGNLIGSLRLNLTQPECSDGSGHL
jgi:hypothetical protein